MAPGVEAQEALEAATWSELLPRTKLEAHTRHTFALAQVGPVSHVRMRIYPDGGVARLRLYGTPSEAGA
jgi:allantoicase